MEQFLILEPNEHKNWYRKIRINLFVKLRAIENEISVSVTFLLQYISVSLSRLT